MKNYYFIIALIMLGFTSCEDVIEIDLKEENTGLYAVEARVTTTGKPYVFLTRGLPVSVDQDFEGLADARVTLSDNANPPHLITLSADAEKPGYYTLPAGYDFAGEAGREYTLTIEHHEVILTAKDVLSEVAPIDSIQIRPSDMGDQIFLGIYVYSQETPGQGNYYKWDVYVNDTLLNKAENLSIANDELVDGNYVADLEVFIDFHDPHNASERKLKMGDRVNIRQTSLSPFSYNYYWQMLQQSQTGFLFSVPPANIKGNITSSDGKTVLGMFSAHDESLSNTVLIDESIESQLRKMK